MTTFDQVKVFIDDRQPSHRNDTPYVSIPALTSVMGGTRWMKYRIEKVQPSKNLEYLLNTPHWLDSLTKAQEKHLDKLLGYVSLVCRGNSDCETFSRDALNSLHAGQWESIPRGTEFLAAPFSPSGLKFVGIQLATYFGQWRRFLSGKHPIRRPLTRNWTMSDNTNRSLSIAVFP